MRMEKRWELGLYKILYLSTSVLIWSILICKSLVPL